MTPKISRAIRSAWERKDAPAPESLYWRRYRRRFHALNKLVATSPDPALVVPLMQLNLNVLARPCRLRRSWVAWIMETARTIHAYLDDCRLFAFYVPRVPRNAWRDLWRDACTLRTLHNMAAMVDVDDADSIEQLDAIARHFGFAPFD